MNTTNPAGVSAEELERISAAIGPIARCVYCSTLIYLSHPLCRPNEDPPGWACESCPGIRFDEECPEGIWSECEQRLIPTKGTMTSVSVNPKHPVEEG